jgi:hypothetical protein
MNQGASFGREPAPNQREIPRLVARHFLVHCSGTQLAFCICKLLI